MYERRMIDAPVQVRPDLVGFAVPQSVALCTTSLEQALALLQVTLAQIDCRHSRHCPDSFHPNKKAKTRRQLRQNATSFRWDEKPTHQACLQEIIQSPKVVGIYRRGWRKTLRKLQIPSGWRGGGGCGRRGEDRRALQILWRPQPTFLASGRAATRIRVVPIAEVSPRNQ